MFDDFKLKALLDTDFPRWKNIVLTTLLTVLSVSTVAWSCYLFFTPEGKYCYIYKSFIYMSFLWLALELVVIGYIYKFNNIPFFARVGISFVIIISNLWFGLFVVYVDLGGCI